MVCCWAFELATARLKVQKQAILNKFSSQLGRLELQPLDLWQARQPLQPKPKINLKSILRL